MLNTLAIVSSNISNFTNESLHKPLSSVKNPNFLNSLQHSSLTLFMPCVTSSSPKPIYLEAKQQDLDNHIVLIDDEIPPPKPPDSIPNMNKIHSPEVSTKEKIHSPFDFDFAIPPKPPYFNFDYASCVMPPPPPTKVYKLMMQQRWYQFDFALSTRLADYMGKE
ncbi:unnamed protein product [Vicia faba]|uniref:Uncharacterized protein n=1 Tax=Vicia faba TaxID=3906 RepID=A0AAV0ZIJ6_VICFA|nr:unnamed protein product [Vicia faba]